MHPEFKRLASLRKFMMSGDPRKAEDFGRAAAIHWTARHGAALPVGTTVSPLPQGKGQIINAKPASLARAIIYIHGGGLVYYSSQVFVPFLAQLSAETGQPVFALDYDKAPETPALDIYTGLKSTLRAILADHSDCRFTLIGDSVGGLLSAQLCADLNSPQISELQMIYPVTDLQVAANDPYGKDHFLDVGIMEWFYGFIRPLCAEHGTPNQMGEDTLYALPKVTVHIAETDILAPQTRAFAARLDRCGRLAKCHEYAGLPHDFCLFSGASEAAQKAVQTIGKSLCSELVDA